MTNFYNLIYVIYFLLLSSFFTEGLKLTILEAQAGQLYYVEEGNLLELTCESSSISQRENVEWFLPSSPNYPVTETGSTQPISVTTRYIGPKKQTILNIRSASSEHTGKYYCRSVQREGGRENILAETTIDVNVYKPITVVNCPVTQWLQVNKKGTLRCELESFPSATVDWIFNGNVLKQDLKYKIVSYGIEISNVNLGDSGHYVVKASQSHRQSSIARDIMVTVFELPKITWGPKIIKPVMDGMPEDWYSDVRCLATGNPMPTVHWFRKKFGFRSEVQQVEPQKYFVNTNPSFGTLRIYRPKYPDDNDIYTCRAMLNNEAIGNYDLPDNLVSRSINLTVSVRPTFVQEDQMNALVKPGKSGTIRCLVRATDPIELYWWRYDGPVYSLGIQKSDPRISVSMRRLENDELVRELTLTINPVKYSDVWNYSCIATVPGFNESRNGTFMIHQIPQFDNDTRIVEFGWIYNATNLTCISYGFPYPQWRWSRSLYTIDNKPNSTFQIISYDYANYSQSWLQIYPDDQTRHWIFNNEYRCTAANDLGSNDRYITFLPSIEPNSPIVKVLNKSSSVINFSIIPGKNGYSQEPLFHNEVIYRASQGYRTMYGPIKYLPSDSIITIHGLLGDTGYQFYFYSCNIVGRSLPVEIMESTGRTTVPGNVQILSYPYSNYPYGYTIEWITPMNGGTPLIGYHIDLLKVEPINYQYSNKYPIWYLVTNSSLKLEYKDIGSSRIYFPLMHNPYMDHFRLDDLEADSFYKITIRAFNIKGFSNSSTFIFATPPNDQLGKPPRIRGYSNKIEQPMKLLFIYFIIQSAFFSIII